MEIYTLSSADYPPQLNEINQPPAHLYVRGTLPPKDAFFLAIVGSRKHTSYGKDVVHHIVNGLRGSSVVIVSGLALGIDAEAHRAAIEVGLPTIAFPGSGLNNDVLYPASNRALTEQILAHGGALVSEFEPTFRAAPYAFPQRNRLMAGLSHGVLIVEAREKSGTLITARLATEYNRDVFAVPGQIFSRASYGPLALIRDGAIPVTSGIDILHYWGITPAQEPGERKNGALSAEETRITEALDSPKTRDEITDVLDLPASEINALIGTLEIKGVIQESGGVFRNVL